MLVRLRDGDVSIPAGRIRRRTGVGARRSNVPPPRWARLEKRPWRSSMISRRYDLRKGRSSVSRFSARPESHTNTGSMGRCGIWRTGSLTVPAARFRQMPSPQHTHSASSAPSHLGQDGSALIRSRYARANIQMCLGNPDVLATLVVRIHSQLKLVQRVGVVIPPKAFNSEAPSVGARMPTDPTKCMESLFVLATCLIEKRAAPIAKGVPWGGLELVSQAFSFLSVSPRILMAAFASRMDDCLSDRPDT